MSQRNAQIVEKADLVVADLEANGGLLPTEQSDEFIRRVLDEPTLLRMIRTQVMNSPSMTVNRIGFANRVLRKAVSQTPLTVAQRAKPTTGTLVLKADEVIAEVRIPYDVIEANIARGDIGRRTDSSLGGATGGIKDIIIQELVKRVALDLEELLINGDTSNASDEYLAMMDGVLKLAQSNVANAGGPSARPMFKAAMLALPTKYQRNRGELRTFMSYSNEIEYADTIAERQTARGDGAAIDGVQAVRAYGIPVTPVALMPDDVAIMTNPLNILFGIQRQIHIETDKDITSREYIIVVTAKVGFQIEEDEAMVKIENIQPFTGAAANP